MDKWSGKLIPCVCFPLCVCVFHTKNVCERAHTLVSECVSWMRLPRKQLGPVSGNAGGSAPGHAPCRLLGDEGEVAAQAGHAATVPGLCSPPQHTAPWHQGPTTHQHRVSPLLDLLSSPLLDPCSRSHILTPSRSMF